MIWLVLIALILGYLAIGLIVATMLVGSIMIVLPPYTLSDYFKYLVGFLTVVFLWPLAVVKFLL